MRAFRAVVETTSFKRAGQRLGIGGSAVSKLVAALEAELGAVLLQRTTRTLALTEAGAAFYESVVRVLDETERAVDRLREVDGKPQGALRVSLPYSFGLRWMASRVPDFLVRYPGVKLDLMLNDRFVDLVAERVDCALRIGSELPDSTLVARRVGTIARVLVAAPRYLKRSPPLREPADLSRHNALLYALASTGGAWPFQVDGRAVRIEVNGNLRVDSSIMLRDALVAGIGVSLTPHFIVQDLLASGELVSLLEDFLPPAHGVFGVTAQRRHVPLRTRVFLDFVEQALQASGYGATLSMGNTTTR